MPYLIYAPGTTDEIIYELKVGKNTIGRAQDNTIVVIQENFSRYHAEITVAESEIVLKDLHSRNGTFVNELRVSTCNLQEGDRVACGETAFKFVEQLSCEPETPEEADTAIIRRFSVPQSRFDLAEMLGPAPTGNSILQLREQQLDRREASKLKVLLAITNHLFDTEHLAQLWERALELLFAIAWVDRAAILVVNEDSQELECQGVKSRSGVPTDKQFYRSKITATVREQGYAILTATATATAVPQNGNSALKKTPGIRGSICVPLRWQETIVGVLYLENFALPNIYPEEDVEFLAAFAKQVAIAFHRLNKG